MAEEWILETAGLTDQDRGDVRRQLGEIMGSLMALAGPAPDV